MSNRENQQMTTSWYLICGLVGMLAGLLFRKDINAELSLLADPGLIDYWPTVELTALEWLTTFQDNMIIGLIYFDIFNLVHYMLVGLMFIGVYLRLKDSNKLFSILALFMCFAGIIFYAIFNQAFTMLSLSIQYGSATTGAQRDIIVSAAEAILAINTSPMLPQGFGVYLAKFFFYFSGILFSLALRRSDDFGKRIAQLGLVANGIMLSYFLVLFLAPSLIGLPPVIAAIFLSVFHILVGRRLLKFQGIQISSRNIVILIVICYTGFLAFLYLIGFII